ncbi:hypothetical protein BK133_29740 [Paenibacillus sp. FSL H8-0548]|uniref:hypothetical protein n=1 Tax=Paenibacillus sp. FSL H8-0548 TaxID=1920422 RepID=UPI00096F666D|nr:hypothetical protein [Paenibacillus sp. FSL H8-0548]OMF19715.1 hypothetical protein BK133_29740 [Paenibacillus sp. FSL H8-0548]
MKKIIIRLLIMCFIITGCMNNESLITGITNVEEKENHVTMEDVTQSLKARGAELFSMGQLDDELTVLNDVKPYAFTIGNPLEDVAKLENIYIYIFESEQVSMNGPATFKEHLETAKLAAFPFYYVQKNVLEIYFSHTTKHPKFGNVIQTALQDL